MADGLTLIGAARDLLTPRRSAAVVCGEATVSATLGPDKRIEELAATPRTGAVAALRGLAVVSGFRAAVDRALPDQRAAHTPLYLLLDEVPVAALISGYADLYLRSPGEPVPDPAQSAAAARKVRADICAGWASDGTMMRALASDGRIPIPLGPAAPPLHTGADPLGWHERSPLGHGAMRRSRRIDVIWGNPLRIDAMFRDTHVGPGSGETVLHEYELSASVDVDELVIRSCVARPRVLPWIECPRAAASAGRLVGRSVGELRRMVRDELSGTSTCTHLNDLLRSLADIAPLAALLSERCETARM
jgi:hypothetical protein